MRKEERRHGQGGEKKDREREEKRQGSVKAGVLSCGGSTEDTHKTHMRASTHTPTPPAYTHTHTNKVN